MSQHGQPCHALHGRKSGTVSREREPEIRSIIAVEAEGFDDDKLMSLGQHALLEDR